MNNEGTGFETLNYFWIIFLAIYIISPFDAYPLFLDDLLAAVWLFYLIYKRSKGRVQQEEYYRQSGQTGGTGRKTADNGHGTLTFEQACDLLGVSSNSGIDEISRAYKSKMALSHPDKVSHLSEELQKRAKELTLELQEAYKLLKERRVD